MKPNISTAGRSDQFRHHPVAHTLVIASQCCECGRCLAYSAFPKALAIAERAHKCPLKYLTKIETQR